MKAVHILRDVYLAAITLVGIAWVMDVPFHLGITILVPSYLSVIAGIATAAGFLVKPYGRGPGLLEVALGIVAIAAWCWGAWNQEDWLIDLANRGPEKWVPGALAVVLATEAMRRNCGMAIAVLVWIFLLYGFFGAWLPGVFESLPVEPRKLVIYLYSDENAIPGLVLRVGATVVLAFIFMARLMEVSGASGFFTDTALATMGHRRGGPAKVAIVASSAFGTINGTTVGNIMSTGIVTIPLMKRSGFSAHYAGAIEAVASNGGQLAPPMMGATAFIIAEFLQIDYAEVALAALLPAVIYYLALFVMVDRYAQRKGLLGMPRRDLPKLAPTLAAGWIYLLPFVVLLYLLFWLGYNPGKSALYASAVLLVLTFVKWKGRLNGKFWRDLVVGGGENLVPLLLVCAGAGIVIGVLNLTGLAVTLAQMLATVAEQAGMLPMLLITAVIAVILGMGMPTSTVYILLSVVLAPAVVKLGIVPLAAHLFIFYFGMLSMLTPPVAIASFVAAGLAGSDMWRTGITGLKLGAAAYMLPFLMVFNPALIMQGSTLAIVLVTVTVVVSGWLLAYAIDAISQRDTATRLAGAALFAGAVVVGAATLWIGEENFLSLVPAALGLVVLVLMNNRLKPTVGEKA